MFWRRNLYTIWISQFIAMLGMSLVVPFLPLFVRELGVTDVNQTAKWSGFVFAGPFAFSFFLAPIWGYLGDRYGRKLMVIRAIFGLAISQLVIAFAGNVYHLMFGRLLQGLLSGFLPAALALVASNTPSDKTGYALGILQTATSAGTVLGPFLGGLLVDFIGIRPIFFLVFGICSISGLLIIFFVKEINPINNEEPKYTVLSNYRLVLTSEVLRNLMLLIIFTQIANAFLQPLFALYVETLNINRDFLATMTGIIFGMMGIFTILSAPIWGKINNKSNFNRNFLLAALIGSICYSLHFILYNPYVVMLVRSALGVAFGGLVPVLFTLVSLNSPLERRGGIMGISSSAQILGNFSGPIISGMIASMYGVRLSFLLASILILVVGFFGLKKIKVEP